MKKITVLLVDDHSVVRAGLHALLQAETDIQVVGQAETGVEAVELTGKLRPDVAVMDIAMPLLNGLEATRQIRAKTPETRILVLSAYSNPACIEQVLALGATGYLIKKSSVHSLAQAIRQVHKGERFIDPYVEASFTPEPEKKKAPPAAAGKSAKRTASEMRAASGLRAGETAAEQRLEKVAER